MYATARGLTGDKDSCPGMGLEYRTHPVCQVIFAKAARDSFPHESAQFCGNCEFSIQDELDQRIARLENKAALR